MSDAFDYGEAQDDAAELLEEFGGTMIIRRAGDPIGPDPWNPGGGEPSNVDHTVIGVLLDYQNRDMDGTMIKAGDRMVILKAKDMVIEPTTTDLLVVTESDIYTIQNVKPLKPNPDAETVLYELQVHK